MLVHEGMSARRKIVVADNSNFGVIAKWLIAPIAAVDVIVTDTQVTDEMINPFSKLGIAVHRV
jgi:DeoR/GlpR family transcriptional regulator of sugar metabolism